MAGRTARAGRGRTLSAGGGGTPDLRSAGPGQARSGRDQPAPTRHEASRRPAARHWPPSADTPASAPLAAQSRRAPVDRRREAERLQWASAAPARQPDSGVNRLSPQTPARINCPVSRPGARGPPCKLAPDSRGTMSTHAPLCGRRRKQPTYSHSAIELRIEPRYRHQTLPALVASMSRLLVEER